MRKTKSLDEYKQEMIGKTYGWLTVLDVFRNDDKRLCRCLCKCGAIVIKDMRKVYNNHTTSCDCYNKSIEKSNKLKYFWSNNPDKKEIHSKKLKQYYINHPELAKKLSDNMSEWCKNNPDKLIERSFNYRLWCKNNQDRLSYLSQQHSLLYKNNPSIAKLQGEKLSQYYKDNPDALKQRIEKRANTLYNDQSIQEAITLKNKEHARTKRLSCDISIIKTILHPSFLDDLYKGNLCSGSIVKTKCPRCDNYDRHLFGNVFIISRSKLKSCLPPLCSTCCSKYKSSFETTIYNTILNFYSGEYIRNTRNIIPPHELDLYYPEKKIAIEFNGDYWHSSLFKDKDYHYNKFKKCYDLGITLVSIFESEWRNNEDEIIDYLKDLFNDVINDLSFYNKDKSYMNNNYPNEQISVSIEDIHLQTEYIFKDVITVHMCGASKILY